MIGCNNVKGTEGFLEVSYQVVEVFIYCFNGGICHLVVPNLREGDSLANAYLAKGNHNLGLISLYIKKLMAK